MKQWVGLLFLALFISAGASARSVEVCTTCPISSIDSGVAHANAFDTLLIRSGVYQTNDVIIDKPLTLLGEEGVLIDAQVKGYGIIVNSDSVVIDHINITNVGRSYIKDFAAIYISKSKYFEVRNCELSKVFFGVLVEKSHYGIIENNHIYSEAVEEAASGNGVHMWYSSHVEIRNNELHNLRDGIYFEFVSHSKVEHNLSHDNLRYGLHFMFSNNDEYHHNTFLENGSGVAVMFSKFIIMTENTFYKNWGSASYGLLLKEIYDGEIENNVFEENTIGIYAEGSTRINYKSNQFKGNGWAVKISGACYANNFTENNFLYNTFDVSYNSKLNDNQFNSNYWSDYSGYDLDRDGVGDVPFRPVKLFSYIVNRTPETILLLRSFFIELLNFSEKVSPVFTPDELMDHYPQMKKIA